VIYLTFDDGPHEVNTPAILETLARLGVHATFFSEGRHVIRHPEITSRTVAEGHAVGNHAWSHPRLSKVDALRIEAELSATSAVIEQACGARPVVFRPPYGDVGDEAKELEIVAQAHLLGMETLRWDVDSYDYTYPGLEKVVANVVDNIEDGGIVLMHDDRTGNDVAVAQIIATLRTRGLEFGVLPIPP
jgi:peptidoglycan/xylan/chitin deacetylase (PgdA/CDA1 family)